MSYRAADVNCATIPACKTMVNEQRVQILVEQRFGEKTSGVLRVDAVHDAVVGHAKLVAREAYVDHNLSPNLTIRAGRQVITWGVGDYLFVNDIFPKNYDGFFTGKPFDHMKEAVDGVKINGVAGDVEMEFVIAKPRRDQMPSAHRFTAAAMPSPVSVTGPENHGADIAMRAAHKFGRWDTALYAARYQSRDAAIFGSPAGLELRTHRTTHAGASAIGSIGSGVALAELAVTSSKLQSGNMNPFMPVKRLKALIGYSRDLAEDLSLSVQYHYESELDYDAYLRSLSPMITPGDRHQQTAYARLVQRLRHQTLGLGFQVFASFDGGIYANPFVSYSIVDGLNLEAGANWFHGPAESRYGMMRHDKNVYASLRYSF
ncbi:MAG: hypothetical protein WKG03_00620 [Telluria sp.]